VSAANQGVQRGCPAFAPVTHAFASASGAHLPADVKALLQALLAEQRELRKEQSELRLEQRGGQEALLKAMTDDGPRTVTSFTSRRGKVYEDFANAHIAGFLADWCGLEMLPGLPTSVTRSETGKLDEEWDAKLYLLGVSSWQPRKLLDFNLARHVLFGPHGASSGYCRPKPAERPRQLTPTK